MSVTFYQENLNVHCWMFFCPDIISLNSSLTGPNNTIYIYIYIYIYTKTDKPKEIGYYGCIAGI